MCAKSNIIDEIRARLMLAAMKSQRGVILQPGAIGDCILTLGLAEFMRETVCGGGVDIIGHTEYIGILPGRSCVDGVRSIESMDLHRLFVSRGEFDVADGDPLVFDFVDYAWIVSFLGEADSDFEQNLIFTAHCSHSAEVMTLSAKPGEGHKGYISEFYKRQFAQLCGLSFAQGDTAVSKRLIRPTQADMTRGREILAENRVMPTMGPIVIQPGSGGEYKCWGLDNFLSVARMLQSEGAEVVFLLGPAEVERFDESEISEISGTGNVLTDLSLAEVVAVLSCAGGYLGNDSGITHLSAAMWVKTVAVFGPTDSSIYGPVGPSVTILKSNESDFTEELSEELQEDTVAALLE